MQKMKANNNYFPISIVNLFLKTSHINGLQTFFKNLNCKSMIFFTYCHTNVVMLHVKRKLLDPAQ